MRFRIAALISTAAAASLLSAAAAAPHAASEYVVTYVDRRTVVESKTRSLERAVGFKSTHRFTRALRGFAATLTPEQIEQLLKDRNVGQIRPARSSYVVVFRGDPDPAEAAAKTRRLEASVGFKSALRYRGALHGFAAALRPVQLAVIEADPDVAFVTLDPWIYVVFYRDSVANANAKTKALERRLGFTSRRRLGRLKAFSAKLSRKQLRAVAADRDVEQLDADFCCIGPAPFTPPLRFSEFAVAPRAPRAGDVLSVSVRVVDSTGVPVTGTLACEARIRRAGLTRIAAVRSLTSSTCLWTVPRTSAGGTIRGWVEIEAGSAASETRRVRKRFSVRIRGEEA